MENEVTQNVLQRSEFSTMFRRYWFSNHIEMKNLMKSILIPAIALVAIAFTSFAEVSPEVGEEVRRTAAADRLKKEPKTAVLYVKGLCCPSCAIGIRKKVSKLAFVDRDQFNKGVDLDAKTQLVQIGLKPGSTVDKPALSKAIDAAGYEPVHLYVYKQGELSTDPVPKP